MTADIAFIGAGNMAVSLVRGLIDSGVEASSIAAADPDPDQRKRAAALGVTVHADNTAAIAGAPTVVLAVKPQVMAAAARGIAAALAADALVVSIAAGIPVAALARWLGGTRPIVRAMPNTPALLGAGITALYRNEAVDDAGAARAATVLDAVGTTLWVDREGELDAVTAVSGSGPAYFFYVMEAMIDAGTALGLTPAVSRELTLATAVGAARMASETDDSPATLRRNVTSRGGTTERALAVLEHAAVADAFRRALEAAAARSRELAGEVEAREGERKEP